MKTLSELTKEYRTLPSGDIYKKTIYGRDYYYHQFYAEGKRIIKIVKKDEYDDLLAKINRRKENVQKWLEEITQSEESLKELRNQYSLINNIAQPVFDRKKIEERQQIV